MTKGELNFKLSIEDCFKINEYLVEGTPCSFERSFILHRVSVYKINVEFELNLGYINYTIAFGKNSNNNKIDISKANDIKDILGLYTFNFNNGYEPYLVKVNLMVEYDKDYFQSIGENLKVQLDLLQYKNALGKKEELLDYITFFSIDSSFHIICACYILELLKGSVYFRRAKNYFIEYITSGKSYFLEELRMDSERKEDIESYMKAILDKNDSLFSVEYALVILYLIIIDERKPYDKLILSKFNEKIIHDSISYTLLNFDFKGYEYLVEEF